MTAITISRKLGSYGGRIAEELARELGWTYADRTLINRVISEYGLIRLGELYDTPPKLRDLFSEDTQWTIEWMNKTIATLAAKYDAVIVGRGGFAALGGYSDVFNVLVTAPEDVRVAREAEDRKISAETAREGVDHDTETKTRFVRRYYGANWADEASYDLVVDTGDKSIEQAVAEIREASQAYFATATGPKASDFEIDRTLLRTIDEQLERLG